MIWPTTSIRSIVAVVVLAAASTICAQAAQARATVGVNARLSDGHQPLAGAAYKRAFARSVPKAPVLDSPLSR